MMASIQQISGYKHLANLPCWRLECGDSVAVVSAYGAHVLAYDIAGSPLLWLSETAVWQNEKAIRGGIPICWPWFGACPAALKQLSGMSDNTQLPNHGIARTQVWQLLEHHASDDSSEITLVLADIKLAWTNKLVNLIYQVKLTAECLTVTLSCTEPMLQQAALHTYFNVSDCRTAIVSPLSAQYYDKPSDSLKNQTVDYCSFDDEIDRVYADTSTELFIRSPDSLLKIQQMGHDASIVWNPGQQKASQAADIAPDTWQEFICVESASLHLSESTLHLEQRILNPFLSTK
jgi:glucose-6-phosphate 1-epimerase